MNISHLKNTLRVLARACITTFIMGIHGIGKSSVAYQLHREIAEERGVSVASLIRQAVDAFLARRKKK